ncbi:MAG: stage III sporulation protein AB [Clostridiales bacterium]|jgi:stage III sporulation protein AB|nr:stage III sporulation protein AB [Clostridiales bacterium]
MPIKIIGMVIVMAACVTAGLYYGNIQNYRFSDLSEMKRALAILAAEIEFARAPLPEAARSIALRVKPPVSDVFENFRGTLVQARADAEPWELWETSLSGNADELYFNREDLEQLAAFGKMLGKLDRKAQLGNIDIVSGYIDSQLQYLNSRRHEIRKLFGGLGVISGLLAVIIFI